MSGFDLATLDTIKASNEGRTMKVRHFDTTEVLNDASGNPVTVTFVGPDSKVIKEYERDLINRRLASDDAKKIDVDAIADERIDLIVRATMGWSGIVLDGIELQFTQENAKMIYTRFPWLAEQANAFIGKRANFLPA